MGEGDRDSLREPCVIDALQICLHQWFMSLSGYGCCAFGGAPLLMGSTLSQLV